MPAPTEGYVLHSYGPERYVRHAVASVTTLRRHDTHRPVALYCPPAHRAALEREGLDDRFAVIGDLPPPTDRSSDLSTTSTRSSRSSGRCTSMPI